MGQRGTALGGRVIMPNAVVRTGEGQAQYGKCGEDNRPTERRGDQQAYRCAEGKRHQKTRYDDRKPGGAPLGWSATPGESIYRGRHAGGRGAGYDPRSEQPSEISGDCRQQFGCPKGAKTVGQ